MNGKRTSRRKWPTSTFNYGTEKGGYYCRERNCTRQSRMNTSKRRRRGKWVTSARAQTIAAVRCSDVEAATIAASFS